MTLKQAICVAYAEVLENHPFARIAVLQEPSLSEQRYCAVVQSDDLRVGRETTVLRRTSCVDHAELPENHSFTKVKASEEVSSGNKGV